MNDVVPGIPIASVKPLTPEMNHCPSARLDVNAVNAAAPCASRPSGVGLQVLDCHYVSTFLHGFMWGSELVYIFTQIVFIWGVRSIVLIRGADMLIETRGVWLEIWYVCRSKKKRILSIKYVFLIEVHTRGIPMHVFKSISILKIFYCFRN